MLQGNMEHAIDATHCHRRDKKRRTKNAKFLSSPVRSPWLQRRRLPPASPRRLPLFQRSWRFALPCSLLFAGWQQRSPTDQVIEQRPQSFLPEEFKCPPHQSRGRGGGGIETSKRKHGEPAIKCGRGARSVSSDFNFFLIFPPSKPSLEMEKLAPPQMRCGVQRPSPQMNGRRDYDDTAGPSPPITSPGFQHARLMVLGEKWEVSWSLGGRVVDNGGNQQQHIKTRNLV